MGQIEYDLEKIAEAFDQKITYCGAKAYGAAGLWAVVGPEAGEDGPSDLISMAALSAEIPQQDFLRLMGAFFWDYVKKENLDFDDILQLVSDILETALIEQAADSVGEYRNASGISELEAEQPVQDQLEGFTETAFEYKSALRRRCGDVKALAAVAWNGTAGDIATSALSSPSMTAEEWANAFRAFLLLPLMDGTLSEEDVRDIFQSAYDMLTSDRGALQSEEPEEPS